MIWDFQDTLSRRLLWMNTGLDVLYVTTGLVLIYTMAAQDLFAAGNGWGIIIQGWTSSPARNTLRSGLTAGKALTWIIQEN